MLQVNNLIRPRANTGLPPQKIVWKETPTNAGEFFEKDPSTPSFNAESKTIETFKSQIEEVKAILVKEQLINAERVNNEVHWFYGNLGIEEYFFQTSSAQQVATTIASIYSAKVLAQVNGTQFELNVKNQGTDRSFFVVPSMPGVRNTPSSTVETMLEAQYLGEGYVQSSKYSAVEKVEGKRHCVRCYRSTGTISPVSSHYLRFYFVYLPKYKNPTPSENECNLEEVADSEFLSSTSSNVKGVVQEILKEQIDRLAPVIRVIDGDSENEKLLLISYRSGSTHSFFSGISSLYHSTKLFSTRKYIDQFSNGITLFRTYLKPQANETLTEEQIKMIIDDVSLLFIFPRTSISSLFKDGFLTAAEYAYAYVCWKFSFQFLSRQTEFSELNSILKNDPDSAKILSRLKVLIRNEAFTEGRVMEAVMNYPNIIKILYEDFEKKHYPAKETLPLKSNENDLLAIIRKQVPSPLDQQIFKMFVVFNDHVLKTNFYKAQKIALSFRLNPAFLKAHDYPVIPFGIFFLIGPEFRGWSIRFRDIARGGIRMIKTRNAQAYVQNVTTLFDENYNLALTQEKKNKDIPEGGSKGTILLSLDQQDKDKPAFFKYIDSLLDLMLPDNSILDLYGKEELIFLGPDEGTADFFMDWAARHAKKRTYKFWKAFTTGKSKEELGGIPHDLYGMTTRSIHQYVLGILGKLGLKEEDCLKLQTGGPDGDLGSNEIKISKDKTVAIVDGSGVLFDPSGINKEALLELANNRKMSRFFPKEKLGPGGFFVDVEDKDIKLPDGTEIASGNELRDTFHLNSRVNANIFIPCGGRPEAVNLNNVQALIDEKTGKPRFRFIVEGANLFFTQEARLLLEQKGTILFKDSSANKGGVTSSSLEVLAALVLTDEEYEKNMTGKETPEFYQKYVVEVQALIELNARLEFECIWKENEKSGTPRSILSDIISNKINQLSLVIAETDTLFKNPKMRTKVFQQTFPKTLQDLLGFEEIIKRLPEAYAKAIFAKFLASRYIYENGLSEIPEFSLFEFLTKFTD